MIHIMTTVIDMCKKNRIAWASGLLIECVYPLVCIQRFHGDFILIYFFHGLSYRVSDTENIRQCKIFLGFFMTTSGNDYKEE